MELGRQWSDRLRIWSEQFEKHYVRAVAPLAVEYFTTMEQLPFARATRERFAPLPVGTRWGKKWEYAWVHTKILVPASVQGERLVFTLKTAPEMLVWVNGTEVGSIDRKHSYITLTRSAVAGTVFDIYAECYAGHGVRNEGAGPVAYGENPVPEPPAQQVTVGDSFYGVWNEALFQVAMDYLTLYQLVQRLPGKSLRAMKILEGLKKFTLIADFELPEPAMTASVVEAGELLKPLLTCKNGSTMPEFTVFGQSHLDMAWLWPIEETMRKTARTYCNQLALMEEYPNYRFLLCEPPILEYLKELYPQVYRRVREKVAEGAFYPEGAIWIESDINIPSGESLIRQIVRGKRWFREELGVDSRMAWMPDTFGFSAALPQILKKCRVDHFATQKLIRQDPEAQPFPYNTFYWEGLDGSRVLAHTFKKNNAVFHPGDLLTRWEEDRVQQENIDGMMYPFGYGDGGGGPTREMVEMANRCADLEGAPRCRMESPMQYFRRLTEVENTFRGELYLAWHRGTLTAQAKTKLLLRSAETALRQTEFFLSRQLLSGCEMPPNWKEELDRLWKMLLFNQFHDIVTGVSIRRVRETAEKQLREVLDGCHAMMDSLLGQPAAGSAHYVFNTLSCARVYRGVTIPAQSSARIDPDAVPAFADTVQATYLPEEGCYELRNRYLVCRINDRGELLGVTRPDTHTQYLSGTGNRLLLFKDVNTCYDAWELGSMYEQLPVQTWENTTAVLHRRPGEVELEISGKLHMSQVRQSIRLTADLPMLLFSMQIDWQEKHKLLKVAFPVNAYTKEAVHEIQFGWLGRPVHRSYRTDKDRYEVCNHRYTVLSDGAVGAAVLNTGKYGVNVTGQEIRLTLLRAPMMPDPDADRGVQEMQYAFYPFDGAFAESDVLAYAAQLNDPMPVMNRADDIGPIFLPNAKNIVVETIKPADTCPDALLVRAYEAMGRQTDCTFRVRDGIRCVEETDMLEEDGHIIDPKAVHFTPFEIKTFLLHIQKQ